MKVSIILKGPKEFEEGPDVIVEEAVDWIPGETVEQLISRLLYHCTRLTPPRFVSGNKKESFFRFTPWGAASQQVIELRLVREVL